MLVARGRERLSPEIHITSPERIDNRLFDSTVAFFDWLRFHYLSLSEKISPEVYLILEKLNLMREDISIRNSHSNDERMQTAFEEHSRTARNELVTLLTTTQDIPMEVIRMVQRGLLEYYNDYPKKAE